jgi:hypothetical protein
MEACAVKVPWTINQGDPMKDHQSTSPVGEFPCQEAFAAARTLEHAGITTAIQRVADLYRVVVAQEHHARALSLV